MKKLLILISILILLTACSNSQVEKTDYDKQSGIDIDLGQPQQAESTLPQTTTSTQDESATTDSVAETQPLDISKINPNDFENLVNTYSQAVLKTNFGNITVKFYNADSPFTVNNFMNLAKLGFYNNTTFHRVIKDFMIQGGDPNSRDDDWSNDGRGGPPYKFKDEINEHKLVKGSLAMANSGPNTNGSQFFIVTAQATTWLDGKHTNFGQVIDGLDIVDKIEAVETNAQDHPTEDVVIEGIELMK